MRTIIRKYGTFAFLVSALAMIVTFPTESSAKSYCGVEVKNSFTTSLEAKSPFLGVWVGEWEGGDLCHTLIVKPSKNGDPNLLDIKYIWGISSFWRIDFPGLKVTTGVIKNGELRLDFSEGTSRHRIVTYYPKEGSLKGVYEIVDRSSFSYGTFRRQN